MILIPTELTPTELDLQREVRDYLDARLPAGSYELSLGMPGVSDPQFSRDLGAQGWLGMALSPEYGGGGRTAVERLIVVEELLARGAPVSYHWVADRQSGPTIERYGSEEQKRTYLPGIAKGELSFAIGMSEPDSGSDLASLRSRAEPENGGWRINGTKVWTSGAAEATHLIALLRTSEERHAGLTQFIVDCRTPGVTISPITFIDGSRHFCEVVFEDVFLDDSQRLGDVGSGWAQNTSELVLERGGVDRWMSMVPILEQWAPNVAALGEVARGDLGLLTARLWGLRGLSLSLARLVDAGQSPTTEAAMVKEMATRFEQECVEMVTRHLGRAPELTSDDPWESLLARAILVSPSWSIRGGTNEILRSIIAKELSAR
jgi:alkylation response protein AidB-like acyl-CoA dehydrogenase